jgi:hypothetical protein
MPDSGFQVDLIPAHAHDFPAPLAEQEPEPDRVGGRAQMGVQCRPERAQLVVGEDALRGLLLEALDHPCRGMRIDQRSVQRVGEQPRDDGLYAVHTGGQALGDERVEQLMDVGPHDGAKRHRPPHGQEMPASHRDVVPPGLLPALGKGLVEPKYVPSVIHCGGRPRVR